MNPECDVRLYLMGVFDGEGCICPTFRKDGYIGLFITVQMASEEVIDLFCSTWGGAKTKRNARKVGYQTLHVWTITGSGAIPFLGYAIDRSVVKQEQARLGIQLAEMMGKYKEQVRSSVKRWKGEKCISLEEANSRKNLALKIRLLNGARSRFSMSETDQEEATLA